MPIYYRLGEVPLKRHTQFRKPDGSLYHEQVFGTIGFEGTSSLLYHLQPPTKIIKVAPPQDISSKIAVENNLTMRKLLGFSVKPMDDFLDSRVALLVNKSVTIGVAAPRRSLTGTSTKTPMPTNCFSSIKVLASYVLPSEASLSSMATT